MLAKSASPDALKARLLALAEATRQRVIRMQAKHRKACQPLERSREEFLRNLDYLKALEAEGRYPKPLLDRALLREELRLKHLEEELRQREEAFQKRLALEWSKARRKAATLMAKHGVSLDLDSLFPEVEHGPASNP
ncbi:hypothetical protein DV704_06365 [Meiothermus sp. QL-1]|uniref:hypothetical protein n=1 Tax=Meiothermus sp. QL-1 TaxID=2058095 RepID=UPI000E0C4BD4|nr:hypothetical protein [Meiothermus sp. QL-1]RDI95502.1 hypothetical protein DV704_06365 [Meiothermus sp. QL-1]